MTFSSSRADTKLLSPMSPSPSAAQHYAREGALTGRILSALTAAGKDLDRLTAEDLSPYDQFHSRGSQATAELAQLLDPRSEEHTSELQSLMRISYAVFCLKKKTTHKKDTPT